MCVQGCKLEPGLPGDQMSTAGVREFRQWVSGESEVARKRERLSGSSSKRMSHDSQAASHFPERTTVWIP